MVDDEGWVITWIRDPVSLVGERWRPAVQALSLRPGGARRAGNPRCLTGLDATGGACGLIGCNAQKLTSIRCPKWARWCMAVVSTVRECCVSSIHCRSVDFRSACPMFSAAHALHRLGACWARPLGLEAVNQESVVTVDQGRSPESQLLVCTHRPSHCPSSWVSEVVTRCPDWKARMDASMMAELFSARSTV